MSKLHLGDCMDVMRSMPDNSIDAIITDPPYGLAFMGAKWDSFGRSKPYGNDSMDVRREKARDYADTHKGAPRYGNGHGPGKLTAKEALSFQTAMTPVFEEALRVAKPGAHLLCFGGTRTFHRMTCAIEDAGWEIRDCIMWVYGCLDEDTEVLVDGEFVRYNKAKKGSLALGYDIESGTFSWQRIEDTYLYDYDDTAYAIQSDCTDQLVSRNHRCIVERGGVEQFAFAEQIALEREASVPVLEGLHGLLDRLPLPDEGAGDEEQDVLEGVRGEGCESGTEGAQGSRAEQDLPRVRKEVLRTASMAEEGKDELLLEELQRQGGKRPEASSAQQEAFREVGENGEADSRAARENDGREEPVVEGRSDVSQAPRELREREVRQMPEGVSVDGSQGRICNGTSSGRSASDRQTACSDGGCSSYQSRSAGQQTREPDAVPDEQGAQALRSAWGAKTTLARVTPVHYEGKMWCIKVATGAFVARRHGKIFITGNSGFPKSMDVAKAIEKQAGVRCNAGHGFVVAGDYNGRNLKSPQSTNGKVDEIPLSLPEAKQWQGWGTCLKPAWEPIIVARKPLDGTVAHNVLTWGVGALNIDACRVPTSDKLGGGMKAGGADGVWDRPFMHDEQAQAAFVERKKANVAKSEELGRFPANLVHDGSQTVLDLFPDTSKSSGGGGVKVTGKTVYGNFKGHEYEGNVGMGDSGSAARFFNTLRDGEESADRTYADRGGTNFAAKPGKRREPTSADRFFYCAKASKKDRGEGNHHPTVKPTALMEWLVKLVTPEGGVVLDPFMGSGTTGVACANLGRRFVGIEREWRYMQIAGPRVAQRERENGMHEAV